MQGSDVGFLHRLPADIPNVLLHLRLRFRHHFFDARGVNAAILNQLGEGQTGDFAADVVEGADDDNAGRVIDDDIDAGAFLEGTDVASFAADDSTFHVIAGNVHGADGGVAGVFCGIAMDGSRQNAAAALLDGLPQLLLELLYAGRDGRG